MVIDEKTMFVGPLYRDNVNGLDEGAVYKFMPQGETWTENIKLNVSDGASYDEFGSSDLISGDKLLVGDPYKYGDRRGQAHMHLSYQDMDCGMKERG